MKSNYKNYIKSSISSTQAAWTTFLIWLDFETWTNLEVTTPFPIVLKSWTQLERMEITATGWTATIVRRGITPDDGVDVSYQKPWNDWIVFIDAPLVWNIIDWKLDIPVLNWKKLKLWANAYVTTTDDGANLKFKDWSNAEVTLTTLNAWAWTDHKVLNSVTDTTAGYLHSKLTVSGNWITSTTVNPWADETTDLTLSFASQAEAETGTDNAKLMTSLRVKQSITANWLALASDAEAIAWTVTTKAITPKQRKDKAIDNVWSATVFLNTTWSGTWSADSWVLTATDSAWIVVVTSFGNGWISWKVWGVTICNSSLSYPTVLNQTMSFIVPKWSTYQVTWSYGWASPATMSISARFYPFQ